VHLSTGVHIVKAEATDDGVRLTLSDGSIREADHLMFGTGYRVDVTRYPFMGEEILESLVRVDGFPVLSRGLETSIAGLHMTGAPAAWSFGPIMRFVSGSWYAGRALVNATAGRAHSRVAV
jgi:FAD-dependent urate hydroxylase